MGSVMVTPMSPQRFKVSLSSPFKTVKLDSLRLLEEATVLHAIIVNTCGTLDYTRYVYLHIGVALGPAP